MLKTAQIILIGSIAATIITRGDTPQVVRQRYQMIVARNAFRLKPMPLPVKMVEAPRQPPLTVVFTGITILNGVKKAFFKVTDPRRPRGQPNALWFPCIAEGQRDGVLEVLFVDEQAGLVKIRNAGIECVLTFEKNGNVPSSAPAFARQLNLLNRSGGRAPLPKPLPRLVDTRSLPILRNP